MDYWKNIGANIRTLRKSRGLTIEDLACVLDIAPGFLGLVERGTRGVSIANLNKICGFFDVTLEQLIRGKVEAEPYVADKDSLKSKVLDLAYSLTDDEIKVVTSNMKRVMALQDGTTEEN
jgi:transcriptional regulator with XRE-family HTH domain